MLNLNEVQRYATEIRVETLKALTNLGFGHYGGSMSVVETLAVLYGAVMNTSGFGNCPAARRA